MTKSLFAKDVPVIVAAFILAFLLPHSISPDTISEHIAGIAFGFGFAWLLKMMIDWKKSASTTKMKGVSNEK